jgi:hypothetical protein
MFITFYATPDGVRFEVNHRDYVRVVNAEGDVVFQEGPYRPAGGLNEAGQAEDIVAFALAYVERPDDFGRASDEYEQVHAGWWRRHGEAISMDLCAYSDWNTL